MSGHFFAILASKWQAEAAASKRLAASNSGNQQLFDSRLGSLPGSILQRTGTWHCKQLRYFVDSVGKNVERYVSLCDLRDLCALWIAYVLYWSLLIFQQHFAITFLTMVDSSRREWNQRCVRATATRELRGCSVKHSALSWQPGSQVCSPCASCFWAAAATCYYTLSTVTTTCVKAKWNSDEATTAK